MTADTDELDMLRATVRKWLTDAPGLRDAGELGLLGLLTPESAGGGGWLPAESIVVAEEAGSALSPLPWSGNLVAAAALASDPGLAALLAQVLAGTVEAVVAHPGPTVRPSPGRVSGRVDVAASDPALLILLDPSEVAVVDCGAPGVQVTTVDQPMDTLRPMVRISMDGAPAQPLGGADAHLLADVAVTLACADSLGALRTATQVVRDHLVARQAFERPLASFQVLQHRLADLSVLEAACTALVRLAGPALGVRNRARSGSPATAAMHSYFVRHVGPALDECIQLAGGIGFTWEFPVHHAMRRAMANGHSTRPHHASLLSVEEGAFAEPDADLEKGFRERARSLIRDGMPFEMREGHRAPETAEQETQMRAWYRYLFDHGLLGAGWPVEWGGDPAHNPRHDLIVTEELIAARAPRPIDQVLLAAHVLLRFGTDPQKTRYLPRIRSAEDIWCQLFSEPDCGSDLAGIKARAERQPDGTWRLSGQKTWTTDGHWAQFGVGLLRTSTGSRRHHGLTAFLVPMATPRIEVRPKMTIGGAYEFNDVFLDGAVLPADAVLGTVDDGWSVAMSGLELERFGVGGNVLLLDLLLRDLHQVAGAVDAGGHAIRDRVDVRVEMAALISDAYAAQAFVSDHDEQSLAGTELPASASIAKLLYTETYNRIARYAASFITEHGPLPDDAAEPAARLMDAWLWSRALTISGGSSEVMRNIIAQRRLALPR